MCPVIVRELRIVGWDLSTGVYASVFFSENGFAVELLYNNI